MSRATFVCSVGEYQELHRDSKTGIAWIEDGRTGTGVTVHPNIHRTGSVAGMRKLGYWGKEDRTVCSHGFIYNIDRLSFDKDNRLDLIVLSECLCGGKHSRQ